MKVFNFSLKSGLVFVSTLMLVACGTQNPSSPSIGVNGSNLTSGTGNPVNPSNCSQMNGQVVTNSQNVSLCKVTVGSPAIISVTNTGNSGYLTWGYNGYTSGAGAVYGASGAYIPLGTAAAGDSVSIRMIPSINVTAQSCFNLIQFVSNGVVLVSGNTLSTLPNNSKMVFVQNGGTVAAQYLGSPANVGGVQFSVVAQAYHCSDSAGTSQACP